MQLILISLAIMIAIIFLIIIIFVASTRKIGLTQILVKSSRLSSSYEVCKGSALVLPVLHSAKFINITPKIIELELMEHESLTCKDGIRIQLKVQFIVSVNENNNEDILFVARKFDASYTTENLETIFLDALTSITRSLNYEEINGSYNLNDADNNEQDNSEKNKCLSRFKQLVLHELSQSSDGRMEENHTTIIFGYRINAVSIMKLEMLHNLNAYNADNDISDKRGITKIKGILAGYESKQNNIRIEETVSREDAKQKIAEKEDEFEIKRITLENNSEIKKLELENKKKIEQDKLNRSFVNENVLSKIEELELEKKRNTKKIELAQQIAEKEIELETQRIETESKKAQKESDYKVKEMEFVSSQKIKELEVAKKISEKEIEHQHELSEFEKQKAQISRIANEDREQEFSSRERQRKRTNAEEEKDLLQQLIENSKQRELLNIAEAKAVKAREIEEANAEQTLKNIKAQTEAQTQFSSMEAQAKAEAFQLKVMSEAKEEAAQHEKIAAEIEAEMLGLKGNVEAEILKAKIVANNEINQQYTNAEIIKLLIPLLPQITANLMSPAEKIDSIKFLNINGLDGFPQVGNTDSTPNTPLNSILNTIMTVGMAAPIIMNVIKMLKDDENNSVLYHDLVNAFKGIPGTEKLLEQLEKNSEQTKED